MSHKISADSAPAAPADALDLAHELADIAARETLPLFRRVTARNKNAGGFDPVTAADEQAEAAMRAAISRRFPHHGIIGEEQADHQARAEHTWILDPIDGTRGFLAGLPTWGTLIGLLHRNRPVFGLMSQPVVGERFFGDGRRAFRRGREGSEQRLHVKPCDSLENALLACTTPDMFSHEELPAFQRLRAGVRDARYGTDCYGYALLAAGCIDLVCEAGLKPFDILPLMPILQGAGAVVSDWQGRPVTGGGQVLASANAGLHDAALDLLQQGAA